MAKVIYINKRQHSPSIFSSLAVPFCFIEPSVMVVADMFAPSLPLLQTVLLSDREIAMCTEKESAELGCYTILILSVGM